jgi:hypothetical protein
MSRKGMFVLLLRTSLMIESIALNRVAFRVVTSLPMCLSTVRPVLERAKSKRWNCVGLEVLALVTVKCAVISSGTVSRFGGTCHLQWSKKLVKAHEYLCNLGRPLTGMRQDTMSAIWPVCGGFHNLIRFNCDPFFASCRRHGVLTVTCLDACRCATYLRLAICSCFFFLGLPFDPEDGPDMFLWNIDWISPCHMALYPGRYNSSYPVYSD